MTTKRWQYIFAQRLAAKMKERGINQRDLAKLSGVSEISVFHYLHSERIPRNDIVIKLAQTLNCSISELVEVEEMIY